MSKCVWIGCFIGWAFLGGASCALAQKHDYNWVFGYTTGPANFPVGNAIIDFNATPPRFYKENLRMKFGPSALVCSDSSGKLLFYSNGLRIYNHKFRLMENGDTLNPGKMWEQRKNLDYPSATGWGCVPSPGLRDCYYFFHGALTYTNGNNFVYGPLYYTLIDMEANNEEGKVLKKNQVILSDSIRQFGLTKHANGRDWWLLVPLDNRPKYVRFLISPSGVSAPMEQNIGPEFTIKECPATCRFSPDGTRFIRTDVCGGLHIFDFDRCTGELSNHYFLPEQDGLLRVGSMEFSPDSRFLYSSQSSWVVQLDLEAPQFGYNAIDSVQRFDFYYYPFSALPTGFGFPKLAPDGKIYWSASSSTRWMHVMHRPTLPGTACDLENHGVFLPQYNQFTVCPAPNYRLGVWEGSPCDTLHGERPGDGFQKTSYETFLERQAKGLPPPIPLPSREQRTPSEEDDETNLDVYIKKRLKELDHE